MNISQGPHSIDDTLTFSVTTHDVATGALTDADAVPDYRVYEDETGTAILTGSMAKLDDANTTGFYSEQITLSAANGFEAGKSYNIYVTAAVDGVTGGTSSGFKVVAPLATASALATVDTVVDAIKVTTDKVDDTLEDDGGTYRFTVNALEEAPTGGGSAPTAAEIADAVWDEATAGHTTSGTFGEQLKTDVDAILEDTGTTLQGELDGIQADTEDIQSRLPAALVSGRMSSDAVAISGSTTAADNVEANIGNLDAPVSTVDTVADAIKAKTDALTFTVSGQVDANVQSVNDVLLAGDGQGTPIGAA